MKKNEKDKKLDTPRVKRLLAELLTEIDAEPGELAGFSAEDGRAVIILSFANEDELMEKVAAVGVAMMPESTTEWAVQVALERQLMKPESALYKMLRDKLKVSNSKEGK